MPTTPRKTEKPDQLKISSAVRELFLNQLDVRSGPCEGAERRQVERHTHRHDGGVTLVFDYDEAPEQEWLVHPRNISQSGIAVLHEAWVEPNTRCRVILTDAAKAKVEAVGTVVDCRHVHGRLHEIGIAFDLPISLDKIAGSADDEIGESS